MNLLLVMVKVMNTPICKDKVSKAAKKSLDFWSSIDGSKLSKLNRKEKDFDVVGKIK